MNIQVLTNVRMDEFFLGLWVGYYGKLFGRENLHIMLDGDDWETDVDLSGVNLHVVVDVPRERIPRLNFTSRWQSRFANNQLAKGAGLVLRTDIDEFLAIDPREGIDLPEFLARLEPTAMKAAFGLDVIQGPGESSLTDDQPLLRQRRNAIVTREYCKLVAVRKSLRWKSGFHRGNHVEIDIAPSLLLFHLALFDRDVAEKRISDRKSVAEHETQGAHIAKRFDRFSEVAGTLPLDFDGVKARAWQQLMQSVPSKTGPHPGIIGDGNVARGYHVRIPDRLVDLLPAIGGVMKRRPDTARTGQGALPQQSDLEAQPA